MSVRRVFQDPAGFAGVGDVRIETMVRHYDITLDQEFDDQDGLETRYILLLPE